MLNVSYTHLMDMTLFYWEHSHKYKRVLHSTTQSKCLRAAVCILCGVRHKRVNAAEVHGRKK